MEFLSDAQAAAYGRFVVGGSRGELERVCFLDDEDKKLIARRRGDRNRLGFTLQLVTARHVTWGRSWSIRWRCRMRSWTIWVRRWGSSTAITLPAAA